jgi:hypothetical protein
MGLRYESLAKSMKKSRLAFVIPKPRFSVETPWYETCFLGGRLGRIRERDHDMCDDQIVSVCKQLTNQWPMTEHWEGSRIMLGHMVCNVS